ncbi:MAG: hypothetical protein QG630_21 [Patescibacteria group bacterium]|nr:hypothetical protein [Patescibacteria group bacterium]
MNHDIISKQISKKLNNISDNILKPSLNFGEYNKNEDLKNSVAALILKKINSLIISINNSLQLKDHFLSTYLYRYIYELHLKIAFIYIDKKKINNRLNLFLYKDRLSIRNCYDQLRYNYKYNFLILDHNAHYEKLSHMIHPNIESINMHRWTEEEGFEFIFTNTLLSIILIRQLLFILHNNDLWKLKENLNFKELDLIINQINVLSQNIEIKN